MVQTWAWFRLALSSYLCSDDWERRMRKTMVSEEGRNGILVDLGGPSGAVIYITAPLSLPSFFMIHL